MCKRIRTIGTRALLALALFAALACPLEEIQQLNGVAHASPDAPALHVLSDDPRAVRTETHETELDNPAAGSAVIGR
jgi:hypothetical protein